MSNSRPLNADTRPNILWICADDYTPDAVGAYGNTLVHTPNLDALIGRSLRFDRAFCTCPLSTPSRQSFWTGRYPRSVGVTLSPTPLPDNEVTLPELLHSAGYFTAAFGKTHYYSPRHEGLDWLVGHREHRAWLSYQPPLPPPNCETLGPWLPFFDPASVWLNGQGLPAAQFAEELPDGCFAEQAVRFLRGNQSQPFFVYVSFDATHSPFRFPAAFAEYFKPELVQPPTVPPDLLDKIPQVFVGLSESEKQGIIASYYAASAFLDHNIGRVLTALNESGHGANTIVIFTSDHGYMLGHRGRFEKHCCYEPAIRVALSFSIPEMTKPATSSNAFVELLDMTPTILDLCGISLPTNLQGRSLLPLLNGETTTHRDTIFVEYADNAEMAVRTDRWKLIYSTGRRHRWDGYALESRGSKFGAREPILELYDLHNDPNEFNNLAEHTDFQSIRDDLLNRLVNHASQTYRGVPPPAEVDVHTRLKSLLPPIENT